LRNPRSGILLFVN